MLEFRRIQSNFEFVLMALFEFFLRYNYRMQIIITQSVYSENDAYLNEK